MLARAGKWLVGSVAVAAVLGLAACSNSGLARSNPFYSGASSATGTASAGNVYDPWTTPPTPGGQPLPARPAPTTALQPAPRVVAGTPGAWTGAGSPPPPPPPDGSLAVAGQPSMAPCPAPCPPVAAAPAIMGRRVVPQRTYSGCGLPCEQGISMWHVRGVVGRAFFEGTDPAEDCTYFGTDVGRTFCGCWGLDAYYRYNSGRFTRDVAAGRFLDGGEWHHIGAKFTYEKGFGTNSRFFGWGGIGGGYFWTDKYIANDSGPEVFGEAGVGYILNKNWRIRAGVNVHGMDTEVTRRLPVDDGQSRWLWILAPVAEVEADF